MLGLELLRQSERRLVEAGLLERGQRGPDRGRHVVERDGPDLVLDAAGGVGVPGEAERVVDRDQHFADALAPTHDDHASYMSAALDDALSDAGELGPAARVERVLARAVL